MTWKNIKDATLQRIYSYSKKGVVSGEADRNTVDYVLSMPNAANQSQYDIIKVMPIVKKHKITQNSIPLVNANLYSYDMFQHINDDIVMEFPTAKAYYFEVDNTATVYILDVLDNVIETITNETERAFHAFKGLQDGFKIKFSGNYLYNIRNVCGYGVTFPSADKIPPFTSFNEYDMSVIDTAFLEFDKNVLSLKGDFSDGKRYVTSHPNFLSPDRKTILINAFDVGEFEIYYHVKPTMITSATADDFVLDIDERAQQLLPLYMAYALFQDDTNSIAVLDYNEYVQKLQALSAAPQTGQSEYVSMTGWVE